MNLRDHIVAAAVAELGVREEGGDNCGPRIRVYQSATWLQPGPWPWCAAGAAFCLKTALERAGVKQSVAERFRCKDASAFGWLTWGQKTPGVKVLPQYADPPPGAFAIFDFNGPSAAGGGHIEIVEKDVPGDDFQTIGFNTNEAGSREGNAVVRKTRGSRTCLGFVVVPDSL